MKLHQPHHSRAFVVVFLLLACAAVLAQSANTQSQNPTPTVAQQPTVQPPAQPPVQPIKLNVIVTEESSNNPVADLRQGDFRVEEDGVPQTITSFAREELPVSYALVVDNSGSTRSVFNYLLGAGGALIFGNKPGDETVIVRFVSTHQISVMQDFTDNKPALMRALESMYVEGGQTSVLDAVYLATERVAERRQDGNGRRRAVVLISDGEDRESYYKLSELQTLLRQHDVQVFVVGFLELLPKGQVKGKGAKKALALLNTLAEETGGHAFHPKSIPELKDAISAITGELRTQYVISYQPANTIRNGRFRTVQVKLNEAAGGSTAAKRIVRARAGYIALTPQDEEKLKSKSSVKIIN